MTPTVEGILLTYLFDFEQDGTTIKNQDFEKLSRKAALHQVKEDYPKIAEQELDIASEYEETIHYLQSINDVEYEDWKAEYL